MIRSFFVGVWVVETTGVKTVLEFMGEFYLNESKRSQVESQSEENLCRGNKSRLKIRIEFHISVIRNSKSERINIGVRAGLNFIFHLK